MKAEGRSLSQGEATLTLPDPERGHIVGKLQQLQFSPPPVPFQRDPRVGSATGGCQVSLGFCSYNDTHPRALIVLGRYEGIIDHGGPLVLASWELCKILAASQITLLVPRGGNFMEITQRHS